MTSCGAQWLKSPMKANKNTSKINNPYYLVPAPVCDGVWVGAACHGHRTLTDCVVAQMRRRRSLRKQWTGRIRATLVWRHRTARGTPTRSVTRSDPTATTTSPSLSSTTSPAMTPGASPSVHELSRSSQTTAHTNRRRLDLQQLKHVSVTLTPSCLLQESKWKVWRFGFPKVTPPLVTWLWKNELVFAFN